MEVRETKFQSRLVHIRSKMTQVRMQRNLHQLHQLLVQPIKVIYRYEMAHPVFIFKISIAFDQLLDLPTYAEAMDVVDAGDDNYRPLYPVFKRITSYSLNQ